MKEMKKYDIDEQFLNKGWAKMRQRLDSELPLQATWYVNKIWYIAVLAATLLMFTGYQCYKFKKVKSSAKNIIPFKQNIEQANNAADNGENNTIALDRTNNTQLNIDAYVNDDNTALTLKSEGANNKILKTNETNEPNKSPLKSFKTAIVKEVNEQQKKHPNKNENTDTNQNLGAYKQENSSPQQKIITTSNSLNKKAVIPYTNEQVQNNENLSITINELSNNKTALLSPVIENEKLTLSVNTSIDFLPSISSQLSNNETTYQLAMLANDAPNSKIWRYKKPLMFGIILGINTNIKDASGMRAGLFANYQLTNKLMLGASIAYAYTAINTNYNVRYNVPVSDSGDFTSTPPQEAEMQRAIVDEVDYNTNQKGVNAKLMLSYLPVKRFGIAAGLFATRYISNNANFDFLKLNEAYNHRALSSNYAYNRYKTGPAFELQYWVKPKLNVAATFEINLIPEVKQEFWATAKQDYLCNSFGIALQYQFN